MNSNWLRYVPAIESLRDYSVSSFRRDVFAGLTVAAVAVPQAMAYAALFGMPPEMGLYTTIVMTAVGALLDSSKQLINGPTNAISIAMLSALSHESLKNHDHVQLAIMMALMIGLIQTALALFRLGDLSRFISHSVIVGFTLGASVLLLLDQLKHVFALPSSKNPNEHFLVKVGTSLSSFREAHWPTFGVVVVTVAVAIGLRWVNRRFKAGLPELLLSLTAAACLVALLGPQWGAGIKLIDPVKARLPAFGLPHVDLAAASELAGSAAAIAFLGVLEALAMAKSIAAKTGQKLDMNQQCLSEGVANLAGSFFHCFPGSGSLTRSYINHASGAATQWSGVISAVGVAATILVLAPWAQYIPRAALAGVLILTASRMVDFQALKYFWKASRFDRVILAATALSAVLISVEFCILIGVLLSFAFYVPKAAQIVSTELTITTDRVVREVQRSDPRCGLIRLYNLEGEMFFGSSPELERIMDEIAMDCPESLRVVILRLKRLRNPDAVCIAILDDFVDAMKKRQIQVLLSGVRPALWDIIQNVKLDSKIGAENIFREEAEIWSSTSKALKQAYQILGPKRCQHCPNHFIDTAQRDDWSYMI